MAVPTKSACANRLSIIASTLAIIAQDMRDKLASSFFELFCEPCICRARLLQHCRSIRSLTWLLINLRRLRLRLRASDVARATSWLNHFPLASSIKELASRIKQRVANAKSWPTKMKL